MQLWRVHLRPDTKGLDPVELCIRQEVVGIGWRVPKKPNDRDEYWQEGEQEYGGMGWSRAANAIGWRMAVGDLVWVRDFYGVYYLGKISGEWEYRDASENLEADIINVRPCTLFRVGSIVAGKIVNCFIPSSTVQQIHDKTAEAFSVAVFNKVSGDRLPFKKPDSIDIFSLLSDVDLEDVIALYLQDTFKLLFVPSSRARHSTTPAFEYQLLDLHANTTVSVQVKGGNSILDPADYYHFPDPCFLFAAGGYVRASTKESVVCIEREAIETYLIRAQEFLPASLSTWLEMRNELNG
ncbi:MAG: hypothetical protein ACOX2I_09945 [Candidatus Ozemobacteraceae bacterium]